MPSHLHEALLLLFKNRPELAAELLRDGLGFDLPAYSQVRIDSAEFAEVDPPEYRADLVVLLLDGKPVFGIIIEVQLRTDWRKRFSWPRYAAQLRARLKCDTIVLVVTPNGAVVRWASQPIPLGGASRFVPVVVGPSAIPLVTDPEAARADPELAVLSTMAHGEGDVETAVRIALAASAGIRTIQDAERIVLYSDLIQAALSEAARKAFAMIPPGYEFQSELVRNAISKGRTEGRAEGRTEGRAEGRTEGRAEGRTEGKAVGLLEGKRGAILAVLESRKLAVSSEQRERILSTVDPTTLEHWLQRVALVASSDELLRE
ncbi:MAG: hypothetical protein ACOY0T_24185 [Myxococcota bacterium]